VAIDDGKRPYRPRTLRQARKLVRRHRGAVERVAHELLNRETLSGEEINRLMSGAAR
jgi:ATP-dependent Zn protease